MFLFVSIFLFFSAKFFYSFLIELLVIFKFSEVEVNSCFLDEYYHSILFLSKFILLASFKLVSIFAFFFCRISFFYIIYLCLLSYFCSVSFLHCFRFLISASMLSLVWLILFTQVWAFASFILFLFLFSNNYLLFVVIFWSACFSPIVF